MPSWMIWRARISGSMQAAAIEQMSVSTRMWRATLRTRRSGCQTEQQAREGSRPSPAWGPPWRRLVLIAQANQAMTQLSSQSEQGGRVTEVIATIAEQTNLLALNGHRGGAGR